MDGKKVSTLFSQAALLNIDTTGPPGSSGEVNKVVTNNFQVNYPGPFQIQTAAADRDHYCSIFYVNVAGFI